MEDTGENKIRKKNFIKQFLLEVFALFIWLYLFIKVFIYDLDVYIIQIYLPNASWIIKFKFPILIGILAIIWLFTKNKDILPGFIYIFFYPLIVIFWKIPKILIKKRSWIGAFALIGLTLSFFKSLKSNTIGLALFLVPACISLWSVQHVFLWGAIILLFSFLLFLYARAFYFAFKPSMLFQIQSSVINWFGEKFKPGFAPDDEIKALTVVQMNEKQLTSSIMKCNTWDSEERCGILSGYAQRLPAVKLRGA